MVAVPIATDPSAPLHRYSVVLPVKRLVEAKSRLAPDLSERDHADLALALAADTVAAAVMAQLMSGSVAAVLAVSDDPRVAETMTGLGAAVVPDLPDAGLNPAIAHGARQATLLHPEAGVAVLACDLPALRPRQLCAALHAASGHTRAFVPDRAGTGTTMLCAASGAALDPAYGPDSRQAHRSSGAAELLGAWPSLRADVDTTADLRRAAATGLGEHVLRVLARLAIDGVGILEHGSSTTPLQGTVADYRSGAGRSGEGVGSVLLDDGTRVRFDMAAVKAGGWRRLSPGQLVTLDLEPSGRVRRLNPPH